MAEAARRDDDFTWDDYRGWSDENPWEIVGGEPFAMSPAPGTRHQTVVVALTAQFQAHFRGRTCQVFVAPTDVKLSESDIFQPDLLVICDQNRITPTHIEGPPSLVIEVLSPSTSGFDRLRKLPVYAANGVKEVWLVTPHPTLVEVLTLDGASYRIAGIYSRRDTPVSVAFPELEIDLDPVFDFPLSPEELQCVKEPSPVYGDPPRPVHPSEM
jgi:Uma2 family endonuclease